MLLCSLGFHVTVSHLFHLDHMGHLRQPQFITRGEGGIRADLQLRRIIFLAEAILVIKTWCWVWEKNSHWIRIFRHCMYCKTVLCNKTWFPLGFSVTWEFSSFLHPHKNKLVGGLPLTNCPSVWICAHGVLWWIGIPSSVHSNLVPSVPLDPIQPWARWWKSHGISI